MDCHQQLPTVSAARLKRIFARAADERLPVSGGFDLTYRCNFRCRHCYVGHLTSQTAAQADELPTAEVVDLLEQAAGAGCLMLLLSGGEPLLRDDFLDIYMAAKRLGMIVSVFTNASLINERHLQVFAEYPPHEVEVSVYGATDATCERVTGVVGSLRRVRRGIDGLLTQGITVGLKTMILRENVDEVPALEAMARDLGVKFRVDPVITPRLNGDLGPLEQRVEPERAVQAEMRLQDYRSSMADYVREHAAGEEERVSQAVVAEGPQRLYLCGAGKASFQLDPRGRLSPCQMSPITYDARSMGFAGAWGAVVSEVDQAVSESARVCATCSHILLCGYCPGLFMLENAPSGDPPSYLCQLGETRYRALSGDEAEVVGVCTI